MKSGIFAVATIGSLRFYVGEVHHLKTRWQSMMQQLHAGTYPNTLVQEAWKQNQGDRRFTFHTAKDLHHDFDLINRDCFLQDIQVPGSETPS